MKTQMIGIARRWLVLIFSTFAANAMGETGAAPSGYPEKIEVWMTLFVLSWTLLTAYCLNHGKALGRSMGLAMAAAICFGVVAWFWLAIGTGTLENPRKFQAPMDAAKPFLIWGQIITALIGGLVLARLAVREMTAENRSPLAQKNRVDHYGMVSRMLHWTTAMLFMLMIPTGVFTTMIPEGVWYRLEYNVFHKTLGVTLFSLVIIRLIWNQWSPRPALDGDLRPVEKKMAHWAHVVLYGLLLALPITGYVMTSMHGYGTFFLAWTFEPFIEPSDAYIYWGIFHKYLLQYLVYIILGAHILGAIKHQVWDKHDNAFKRMVL